MNPAEKSKGDLAGKVNFPLYTIKMLTNRHFIVGGGGGAAKTGVYNGFVSNFSLLFSLFPTLDY